MPSLSDFRAVSFAAAHQIVGGGRVVEFRIAEEATPNFHQAVIATGAQVVAVVCVLELGVLAIAEPRDLAGSGGGRESGPLSFVEAPDLSAALSALTAAGAADFRLLTTAELTAPFDSSAGWPPVDPQDIRYWQPSTVGEAVFNYWD